MMWGIYNFVINQIEVFLTFYFMCALFERRLEKKGLLVTLLVCQGVFFQFSDQILGSAGFLGIVLSFGISVALYKFIFDGKAIRIFLFLLFYIVMLAVVEVLTFGIVTAMFDISTDILYEHNLYRIIGALFSRGLIFLIIRFIRKRKISHKNLRKVYVYEFVIILLSNVTFFLVVLNIYKNNMMMEENAFLVFAISSFLVIFTILIIKVIDEIIKYSQKEFEWDMVEREYERQINYINSLDELTYKLKSQRHDFNHHIGCLYGLIERNEMAEAKCYIEDIAKRMQKFNDILCIDNPIIGALVNYKLTIAEEKEIKTTSNIVIPKIIPFEPIDISIIVGNAIDNAIEACEYTDEKFIDISMSMEKKHLFIKVTNSKEQGVSIEGSKNKTRKDDKENHGFGLENIQYAVEKYDGLMKVDEDNETFTLNIALRGLHF